MFTVFYSWQSDIDFSRGLIRGALGKAQSICKKKGVEFTIQESARGVPGSPDIANVILARIRNADAVVSDVSIVNGGSTSAKGDVRVRPTPNPNVLIELGFAAGILGWERLVMVFNTSLGEYNGQEAIPKEVLPFDLGLKQVVLYRLSSANEPNKNEIRDELAGKLASHLHAIFMQAERTKEFDPILKSIIRLAVDQYGKGGDQAAPFYDQCFGSGDEHLLWASQDEIVESSGKSRDESLPILEEMAIAGLIVADKTNLGHKTWYLSKKGHAVAKQRGLFRA